MKRPLRGDVGLEEALLAEYASLRNEITVDQNRSTTVFTFSIAIAPAILGLVNAGSVSPFLYLTPLLVILPARYYMDSLDRAIYQKAHYLRDEIEPKVDGLNWETHLHTVRKNRWAWYGQTFSVSLIYSAMAAVSLVIFVNSGIGTLSSAVIVSTVALACILLGIVCVWLPYGTHRP